MTTPKEPEPRERPDKAERSRPIPNADRRRKVRKDAAKSAAPMVISDWASI